MKRRILEELTDSAIPETSLTWSLHGRATQVGRVEQLMRDSVEEQRSHVVVLESGAGTGKTRLLLELMSCAARRGFAVVNGAADQPGLARAVTLVNPRNGRQEDDRIGTLAGRFEAQLTGHLRRGPVLVAVDDVQWTDLALLHALGAVVSKLDSCPVVWLFAVHADHTDSPNGVVLRTLARKHRAEWLGPLEPLTGEAVAGIAGDLLDATPDDDVLALCESVGGTPQAIVDLVLDVRREGCVTVTDQVARLASGPMPTGISSAVEPDPGAPLPRPFVRLMQSRLRELSPRAQEVLQVAAVLGSSFAPQDLAEMLGERPAQLLGPLQEALTAGLIGSDSDEFVFRREPVWRAVLGTVPEVLRSMLHRQAATMLLDRPQGRIETAAVHLVHCAMPGDAEAIGTIRAAAERMLAGSPQAASALATRGLRIAPPDSADHAALATTATAALVRLGCLSDAVELAEEQLRVHTCPELTRPLRTWLATALMLRGDTAAAFHVSNETIADAQSPANSLSADTEPCPELLLLNALCHNDQSRVVAVADRVLDVPGERSDEVRAAALNVRAMAYWREGRLDAAMNAVDEAVRLRGPLTRAWQSDPLWTRAWLLTRVRRLDEALAAADAARRAIDTEHNGVLSPVPLALRATILLAKGDLAAAESDATAGLTASERAEMPLYEPQLHAVLVISALRRGDLATASDGLRRLEECAPAERAQPWTPLVRVLSALVTSARRDVHAAMEELREPLADPGQRRQLLLEDPSMTAWVVRTALAADAREIAEGVVVAAEKIAAENQRYVTIVAAARHGRALLDSDVSALSGLEERYGDPWAAASVIEDTGTLLRDTDRDHAVAELNRAMAAYDELGAEWDSARVRRKLRRLGVRRRHWNHEVRPETGWGSLTSTEAKVARLVARGLTNRQVASEMFVSPHTVGFHLRQIYRKLSIQSRVDLARIAP
nr:LuxR-type transcriptional regulator [uncultured bacterium]